MPIKERNGEESWLEEKKKMPGWLSFTVMCPHRESLHLCPPQMLPNQPVDLLWKSVNGPSFLHTEPVTTDATAGVTVLTSGSHLPNHRVGMGSQNMTPKTETIKETEAKYGCTTPNRCRMVKQS